jgi:pyruvate,orthophosphate dikinase
MSQAVLKSEPVSNKWVYAFGSGKADGRAGMKNLLGGKGANLAEMSAIGLPVPPGFTITTEVCTHFYANQQSYPAELKAQVAAALAEVEQQVGAKFGDARNPLLLSVRSGARASMPGMMDTVLNLGLNPETTQGLAEKSGDARFAWDSFRRFIQMYGAVVLGLEHHFFEDILDTVKREHGLRSDTDMAAGNWQLVAERYLAMVREKTGQPFPMQPEAQLWGAIGAVFGSWMNQRAITYRKLHDIPADWGTAVNVQAMVFGNRGEDCATGVAFTRNPSTGENVFYGEYLINAQGEDVVAGIRTPKNMSELATQMPAIHAQLMQVRQKLEHHYRDMQDIEFTVQQDKLYMLQTRNGKRTAAAALKIACDMVREGLIDKKEAISRISPASLEQLLHPTLDPKAEKKIIAKGLPASPGAVSGKIVFTAEEAELKAEKGEKVILCRVETSPEDIHGMHAAVGILTTRGGMTSHAAVVARGMGRACVAGAGEVRIDAKAGTLTARGHTLKAGDVITLDGAAGEVMLGAVGVIRPAMSGDFAELMGWADSVRKLKVRANAETPLDAEQARKFGAEGIGLCRTEHMFFDADRISAMREMILADDEAGRRKALAKLQPMQTGDFEQLFTIMAGLPVTIRLLDPPLHEFLPHTEKEVAELAAQSGLAADKIRQRSAALTEANPMLGHRGCRLGITYPEIYEMQLRAIFAAVKNASAKGVVVDPEIMFPLIATKAELDSLKAMTVRVAAELGVTAYKTGIMIELPRAALRAGELAETAEFFSFGTNDLTQTTFGLSRDDAGNFLPDYLRRNVLAHDPFVTLDVDGVGELVKIAADRGRATRPALKLGICGEHGGDPASIAFCAVVGLDYVSCSPYRVPIARLAAAQAALGGEAKREI